MAKKKSGGVLLTDSAYNRRYPQAGTASSIYLDDDESLWLPSRILPLNYQFGGGIPYGKILDLHGEESTGKTLLALDFGYVTQQCGGIILWDDAECSFDATWARKHGINTDRVIVLKDENAIEVVSDWLADTIIRWRKKLTNNEPILAVVDSLAALDTLQNLESADVDSGEDMGKRAKWIYQMIRKRNPVISKYGVCGICINQLRKKVGASKFEDPDTTPGGMAMKFYGSIRAGMYRGKTLRAGTGDDEDGKGMKVGQINYLRIKKNKVAPPRENIQLKVFFEEYRGEFGFSKDFGLEELLVTIGVVKRKRGGNYYYKGELIAQGERAFKNLLRTDLSLRRKFLKRGKINTISQFKEKLASIEENRYPVNLKSKSDE